MNINQFKEGDFITRNEPMRYAHNGSADGSWTGDKLKLLGVDKDAKIIFLQFMEGHFKTDEEPHTISYARDAWDEGWTAYPQTVYEKARSLMGVKKVKEKQPQEN